VLAKHYARLGKGPLDTTAEELATFRDEVLRSPQSPARHEATIRRFYAHHARIGRISPPVAHAIGVVSPSKVRPKSS
jgi:hypothetical protein